jgi:translation initiation factor IF-1
MQKELSSDESNGKVVQALSNATFRVLLDDGRAIFANISGKIRKNYIRILIGDSVIVKISPYDKNRGRIVYRST